MKSTQPTNSMFATVGRIFWVMLGPMLLVVFTLVILSNGSGWFTAASLGFLATLIGLILARWLEFRFGNPLTSTGQPATPADFRQYALYAIVIGLGTWVVANLLGNHLLSS